MPVVSPLIDVEVERRVPGYMELTAVPRGRWRAQFSIRPALSLRGPCAGLEFPPLETNLLAGVTPHIHESSRHQCVTSPTALADPRQC